MAKPAEVSRHSRRLNTGLPEIQTINKDRKSTRLNSSHSQKSYAVFCLNKNNVLLDTCGNAVLTAPRDRADARAGHFSNTGHGLLQHLSLIVGGEAYNWYLITYVINFQR